MEGIGIVRYQEYVSVHVKKFGQERRIEKVSDEGDGPYGRGGGRPIASLTSRDESTMKSFGTLGSMVHLTHGEQTESVRTGKEEARETWVVGHKTDE